MAGRGTWQEIKYIHTYLVSLLLVKFIRGYSGLYEIVRTITFEVMGIHEYLWMVIIQEYHFLSIKDDLLP